MLHENQSGRSSRVEISDLIRARYPLIYLVSHEESRVEGALRKLCIEREMRMEVWSVTQGWRVIANGSGNREVKDPMKALDHVLRGEGRGLYIPRDFHPILKEPSIVRRVRDLAEEEEIPGERSRLGKYLKCELLIIDDMGIKQLPAKSGEYLFDIRKA